MYKFFVGVILFSIFFGCKKEQKTESELAKAEIKNPILKGFYPDPSIVKVKEDYYLVNSTFSYFPGLPIFHSKDLVNWKQIGHAMDRAEQLNLDGLGLSRGLFAPDISYNNGTYYIVCTLIDNGNNFIISSKDPSKSWSNPVFIPELDGGIDPSLFFDDDGKTYIIYNFQPPNNKEEYAGHRTLKMYEFDIQNLKVKGDEILVVDKGAKPEDNPVWIEGPHIFKNNDYYYLIAAEGGTGFEHSEVVFRSKSVLGPFISYKNNPVLTQRDLDPKRLNPITTTGHADFFEDNNGNWFSVFLGCRPYPEMQYNTGRETFMAPVKWENNWPIVDLEGDKVKYSYIINAKAAKVEVDKNNTRNYFFDDFKSEKLNLKLAFLRTPRENWYTFSNSNLNLETRPESASNLENPSFIGHRQEHLIGEASVKLNFSTEKENEKAGLIIFQNEKHYYYLAKSFKNKKPVVQLLKSDGENLSEISFLNIDADNGDAIFLKIEANSTVYNFYMSNDGKQWINVASNIPAEFLSTETGGGFVGAFYGMYTTSLGKKSENSASFDWFKNVNKDFNDK